MAGGTILVGSSFMSSKQELIHNRRPSAAYLEALRSRVQFLENLFQKLKTGKEEEAQEVLRRIRAPGGDSDIVRGRLATSLGSIYMGELQKDSPDDADSILLSGSTKLDTSTTPEGSGQRKAEAEYQPGLQGMLIDELSQVMSQLNVDDGGEVRYFGPSSNLNLVSDIPHNPAPHRSSESSEASTSSPNQSSDLYDTDRNFAVGPLDTLPAITGSGYDSYFNVGNALNTNPNTTDFGSSHVNFEDQALEEHLLSLYWTWQHPFFRLFSKRLFLRDMEEARSAKAVTAVRKKHFSPLLLNAILAHAAHSSDRPGVLSDPNDPATAGNRFFANSRRLLEDECENPSITTVQALALMGSREAGCGRDTGLGWLYSGMRACDSHVSTETDSGQG
jgi:hypothetical protein